MLSPVLHGRLDSHEYRVGGTGDYGGRYRPQVHSSPPQHFVNDPSGVFRSILELFLNDGIDSATTAFFMALNTSNLPDGMRVSVRINALRSAWASTQSPDDGLVYGDMEV
ncbi:Hypothetical protein TPAR_09316 [Tolypocladium paradoxum]|uniref:Uncharacterized protein n=1 Tax=Tolypocladium paradoxum TaxID=94208 RepID=A0A2S4KX02_9HYPO|nr:Hypothetical protein TPAR_09316 [Tolypocladium paradoxum]